MECCRGVPVQLCGWCCEQGKVEKMEEARLTTGTVHVLAAQPQLLSVSNQHHHTHNPTT